MGPRVVLPALLLAALTFCACGGGDDDGGGATDARTVPRVTIPRTVAPADARTVRAWADALRHGDEAGAARYFAPGSRVANGGEPLRLRTTAAARAFNHSLPCGAVVTQVEPSAHGFVIATFRLTERPGAGSCGDGTGHTARVALRIADGRISDWIRLEEVPTSPPDGDGGEPAGTPA
jgi:hypothetical protein